jgi:hypothetical protein
VVCLVSQLRRISDVWSAQYYFLGKKNRLGYRRQILGQKEVAWLNKVSLAQTYGKLAANGV